jgi:hypothetical protein
MEEVNMDQQIVSAGVDTLYVNVYYTDEHGIRIKPDIAPALARQLEEWKKYAQEISAPAPTEWEFNGANLHMCPNGAGQGQYRWMLKTRDITLYISQGGWNGVAAVRFNSDYLWGCRGLSDALLTVNHFLFDIFEDVMQVQPSSIDLCADIAGWDDIQSLDRTVNFVTRSRKRTLYSEPEWGYEAEVRDYSYGLHGTGFDFSRKGPMSCRIYDKTREVKKSGKTWLPDLWRSRGWDEAISPEVWRTEFSFGREVLRDFKYGDIFHGIEDAYELPELLEILWAYAAGCPGGAAGAPDGWLRCVIPTDDKNRARWPTHPAWSVVQSAFTDLQETPVHFEQMIRKAKENHSVAKGVEALIGYATSVSSWVGGDLATSETDLSMFLHWFLGEGERYLERTGRTFGDEVVRKRVKFFLQSKTATKQNTLRVTEDEVTQ